MDRVDRPVFGKELVATRLVLCYSRGSGEPPVILPVARYPLAVPGARRGIRAGSTALFWRGCSAFGFADRFPVRPGRSNPPPDEFPESALDSTPMREGSLPEALQRAWSFTDPASTCNLEEATASSIFLPGPAGRAPKVGALEDTDAAPERSKP